MGDALGFDLVSIEQLAEWHGFEIGPREAELIRIVEIEWLRRRQEKEQKQPAKAPITNAVARDPRRG
jgi:hypothetical protein